MQHAIHCQGIMYCSFLYFVYFFFVFFLCQEKQKELEIIMQSFYDVSVAATVAHLVVKCSRLFQVDLRFFVLLFYLKCLEFLLAYYGFIKFFPVFVRFLLFYSKNEKQQSIIN